MPLILKNIIEIISIAKLMSGASRNPDNHRIKKLHFAESRQLSEELFVILKKKEESIVEKTAGNEMDEELIDSSIELTESGEYAD